MYKERIKTSRMRIAIDHPWFAELVFRLQFIESEDVPTMGTDGTRVYYNTDFMDTLDKKELDGVILHEALHCGFLHHTRKGDREHRRWNAACDYAINPILLAANVVLPKEGLFDKQYSGMSAEEIYAKLPKDATFKEMWGEILDGAATEAEKQELREAMSNAVHRMQKKFGSVSGDMEQLLKELSPTLPWQDLLAHLMTKSYGQDDYTWAKPSSMGRALGVYLPSTYSNSAQPVVICVDTSGSMFNEATMSRCIAEVQGVIEQVSPTELTLLFADTSVKTKIILAQGEEFDYNSVTGGGGTCFIDALEKADELDPACIIYLTDLEGSFPSQAPMAPVIWITDSVNMDVPFGDIVEIDRL